MKKADVFLRRLLIALCVSGLLLLAACGGGNQPATEPTSPPAEQPAAANETDPTPTTEAEPPAEDEPASPSDDATPTTTSADADATPTPASDSGDELSEEPLTLRIGAGLDELESYHLETIIGFDGKDANGMGQAGTTTITVDSDNTTNELHASITMGGPFLDKSGEKNLNIEMFQVDEESYLFLHMGSNGDNGGCEKSSVEVAQLLQTNMEELLGTISDARMVASGDEVNDIPSDHYTIEDASTIFATTSIAEPVVEKADVWVAQEGGYVVKMDVQMEGKDDMGSEGVFTLQYNLSDVNEPVTIDLPTVCEQAPEVPGALPTATPTETP